MPWHAQSVRVLLTCGIDVHVIHVVVVCKSVDSTTALSHVNIYHLLLRTSDSEKQRESNLGMKHITCVRKVAIMAPDAQWSWGKVGVRRQRCLTATVHAQLNDSSNLSHGQMDDVLAGRPTPTV